MECTTAEAAELVISTSGLEFRAVVVDQNLDGQMLGSELAAFACTMAAHKKAKARIDRTGTPIRTSQNARPITRRK